MMLDAEPEAVAAVASLVGREWGNYGYRFIAEAGDLRVRIEIDETPEPPYDEGGAPILRDDENQIDQVTETTSYVVHPGILDAANRWGFDDNLFVRYLRAFHGVTRTDRCSVGRSRYLSFDPADWRERVGLTPEFLAAHPDVNPADLSEWEAYCEGDVYGWVIERRVTWQRLGNPTVTREEWETVDSCWGFYGREYAEEAAREALDDAGADSTVRPVEVR
jgi:hypothetical protein